MKMDARSCSEISVNVYRNAGLKTPQDSVYILQSGCCHTSVVAPRLVRKTVTGCNLRPALPPLTQELVPVEQILEVDRHALCVELQFRVPRHQVVLFVARLPHSIIVVADVSRRALCGHRQTVQCGSWWPVGAPPRPTCPTASVGPF